MIGRIKKEKIHYDNLNIMINKRKLIHDELIKHLEAKSEKYLNLMNPSEEQMHCDSGDPDYIGGNIYLGYRKETVYIDKELFRRNYEKFDIDKNENVSDIFNNRAPGLVKLIDETLEKMEEFKRKNEINPCGNKTYHIFKIGYTNNHPEVRVYQEKLEKIYSIKVNDPIAFEKCILKKCYDKNIERQRKESQWLKIIGLGKVKGKEWFATFGDHNKMKNQIIEIINNTLDIGNNYADNIKKLREKKYYVWKKDKNNCYKKYNTSWYSHYEYERYLWCSPVAHWDAMWPSDDDEPVWTQPKYKLI